MISVGIWLHLARVLQKKKKEKIARVSLCVCERDRERLRCGF